MKIKSKLWRDYPVGTKAFSIGGGFWRKVERGWKWCTGDTFPTPGGDAYWVEEPDEIQPENTADGKGRGKKDKCSICGKLVHETTCIY